MIGERGGGTDEGGREESDGHGGGCLIDSHTRVVSQTDLHTRPQGTLDSVCLSLDPQRVGGLYPHLLSYCDSLTLFISSKHFALILVQV